MKRASIGFSVVSMLCAGIGPAAHAALSSSAVLAFDDGIVSCVIGGVAPYNCDYGLTTFTSGSYFAMDTNGDGVFSDHEKTPLAMNQGLILGVVQETTGQSHTGAPDGSEITTIDHAWWWFGNTGMHNTVSPVTIVSDDGAGNVLLDFSGWRVDWNGVEDIDLGADTANFPGDTGLAALTCANTCEAGDAFALSYGAHTPGDKTGISVAYSLYLEGTIVPVPAAVWLFGSGLLGLVGVARRKKA